MTGRATLIGVTAILMWSLLALFTATSAGIPQFQLLALTFSIGGLIGILWILPQGRKGYRKLLQPPKAWFLAVSGLFGYHFLYFTALGNAPVADAGLIAYLWPLLIVLFSALLPGGDPLRWFHLAGAFMGLFGAGLLIAKEGGFAFSGEYITGYLAAMACALVWSLYSVINRTQAAVPTEAVTGFCLMTAFLALLSHFLWEDWVSPTSGQWMGVLALGAGPVGLAFFTWDYGTKRGNIRLLGVFSYAAPLLSTLILTASGAAEPSWNLLWACLLITGGAVLASLDFFRSKAVV